MRFQQLIVMLAVCLLSAQCKPRMNDQQSSTKSLFVTDGVTNVALILAVPGKGENFLSGPATDAKKVPAALKRWYGAGAVKVVPIVRPTKREILASITANAKLVGDDLGTFLIYFSGHGGEGTGYWSSEDDQDVTQAEVLQAIRAGRQRPFRRLILLSDSCFSGMWVNGKEALGASLTGEGLASSVDVDMDGTETADALSAAAAADMELAYADVIADINDYEERIPPDEAMALVDAKKTSPFSELFIFAAAAKNQTATDNGKGVGGAFTSALTRVMDEADAEITIKPFADMVVKTTVAETKRDGDMHKPAYKLFPAQLGTEKMFGNFYTLASKLELDHATEIASIMSQSLTCKIGLSKMITGSDENGRFRMELVNNTTGVTWLTWANITKASETEAMAMLKQMKPNAPFYQQCKRR